MKKAFLLPLLLLFCAVPADGQQDQYCQTASSAIQEASSIRGLKIRHQIPCRVHDRNKVRNYLLRTIREKLPPERLKMEGLAYKLLGLVPPSFDYEHGIVDFYLSQIGGYYDPEKKHFVMAAWMPVMLQTTVAVHELTHGLQDQHYDLEKFMDMRLQNSDLLLARSALVEGDATCVMLDYMRKLTGQQPLSREKSVESFMMQNIIGASLMGGSATVPESIKLTVIFPYTSGVRFAHDLLRRGGYSELDRAFARPPSSTEEILHLEKYSAEKPDFVNITARELRPADFPADSDIKYEDTLGEFVISTLLGSYERNRKLAIQAAAGWGGDRLVLFARKADGKWRIVWRTKWDSELDAREFFDTFLEILKVRSSSPEGFLNLIDPQTVDFSCEIDLASNSCA